MKATHFLTLNATTGRGRLTPLVTNKPKPEPSGCGCGTCRPGKVGDGKYASPPPFDPAENRAHAVHLERQAAEAERAGNPERAKVLRSRALLVHDLNEAHDREEARKEARRIGTSWKPSAILG